jgi:hydrogenase expression/formation protein HypD
MEICGTHTMAIARNALRSLLPEKLRLVSGPGCPVCVTDQSYMDRAVYLARTDSVTIATYGDMVRVPGSAGSLADARGDDADIQVVYGADQAVDLAMARPDRQVVFLGVGFETTAPATALAVQRANREGLKNFSVLAAHKRLLPAMHALLSMPEIRVDGFLCPGHVSVILGYAAFEPIVKQYQRPCVVSGFESVQILEALDEIVRELNDGAPQACSVYSSVSRDGNLVAQKLLDEVFEPEDAAWRGLGVIAQSGMKLRSPWSDFDTAERFDLPEYAPHEMPGCRCGDVITGQLRPRDCKLFAGACTVRTPVGPCMVSSEGACAAAFKYERNNVTTEAND